MNRPRQAQRVLITGGTGVLGQKLAPRLAAQGHRVRIASRRARPAEGSAEVGWAQMQIGTGAGLEAALDGIDTVIHAASTPVFSRRVDIDGTARLLDAVRATGTGHLLYISIVGIDDFPFAYYRAKRSAEELIESADVPFTILRATQFHELLDQKFLPVMFALPFFGVVPVDFRFQLIDAGEVADRLVELVGQGPSGRVRDIGGPEVLTLGELAPLWLTARGIRKKILPVRVPGGAAAAFRRGQNTCPNDCFGRIGWSRYLADPAGLP